MSTGCGCGCGGSCGCDGPTCGCCEGIRVATPRNIYNRPGLSALDWRVGRYGDFLDSLTSRIPAVFVDVETDEAGRYGRLKMRRLFPLRDLRTREEDDPTIALLHAWSAILEVLSFYTERIVQEGYLNTATELRSVIELGRLIGYRRRPGVSASVYLAFGADETWKDTKPLIVPKGARVQSMPEPNEPPVTFETDGAITARPEWNVLAPRQTRPIFLTPDLAKKARFLTFAGTATNLSPNNVLLLIYGEDQDEQIPRFVQKVVPDFVHDRTEVELIGGEERYVTAVVEAFDFDHVVDELKRRPAYRPPASAAHLAPDPQKLFGSSSSVADELLLRFHPELAETLLQTKAHMDPTPQPDTRSVQAFRVKASVYASTAPVQVFVGEDGTVVPADDWPLAELRGDHGPILLSAGSFKLRILDLDTTYDAILPGSWVMIDRLRVDSRDVRRLITRVDRVETVHRTDYNFPARVTRLYLNEPWLTADMLIEEGFVGRSVSLSAIRQTVIYAAPEELALADVPITEPICGSEIELDRQLDGLQPGRWLVIAGERAPPHGKRNGNAALDFDIPGVIVSELAMLSGTRQDTLYVVNDEVRPNDPDRNGVRLPGDRIHTFLQLATPLRYCYKRSNVTIHGNVVEASHGETRREALGSGDATKASQSFSLRSSPLTYAAATTPSGVQTSLDVFVNDVRWYEAESLLDLGQSDRGFVTVTDPEDKTTVLFGDGHNGARLPSGIENVKAIYRNGIGRAGNVRAGQLKQLVTNVEGLRIVVNPRAAFGGADPEGLTSIRRRAPLAVAALDRLVSTLDYADFARLFAGVGKAAAVRLASPHGHFVHVTIAGQDDFQIDETSALYRNLLAALKRFGDPNLPIVLARRELLLLVIAARVRVRKDYLWGTVLPQLRTALWTRFGFEERRLVQDAYATEAIATMQGVPGVDYVDLEIFTSVSERLKPSEIALLGSKLKGVQDRIAARPAWVEHRTGEDHIRPAQLVMLSPQVPTTLMLTEITDE
jgi:hypothetical protein